MSSSVQGAGAGEAEPDLETFAWHSVAGVRIRALRWLENIESAVSIALIVTIFAALILQIVSRRLEPIPWTDELVRYANIMLGFAAAAYAMALGEHIKVDLIDRFLPPRVLQIVKASVWGLIFVGASVLTWVSYPYVMSSAGRTSVAMQLPLVWLYGIALLFLALQAVHALVNLIVDLRSTTHADAEITA